MSDDLELGAVRFAGSYWMDSSFRARTAFALNRATTLNPVFFGAALVIAGVVGLWHSG